ncbi:MAG: hypothetical protein RJA57_239 [Bacteroidota bacterium]|jgi:peptidyl-prolyl cis-trans isomerase SurA
MKKTSFLFVLLVLAAMRPGAQTLFTYGKHAVDAKDFLRAFNKNNTQPGVNKATAMREYLDLYIRSRMKIQEAHEKRLDTLPLIRTELENLRGQITENYLTDPIAKEQLTREAFQRSLKDIRVAHIFISLKDEAGFMDSVTANRKKAEVLRRLQQGEDFGTVARDLSDDPGARTNLGEIGYITVFTLPYEFESAIYKTPVGSHSAPVRSLIGYHIFKNLGERKAVGRIKAQQILLAHPPGATPTQKDEVAARADSLYRRILAGDNFTRLAADFSNDLISSAAGGQLPDIGVGQYDPVFEKELWALPTDGALSLPFQTSYGWHILRRVSAKPVVTDPADKTNLQELQQRVQADGRWKISRDFIYKMVTKKKGLKRFPYEDAALWNMSDSVLDGKPMTSGWAIKATTPLMGIGDSVYNATDWVRYANTYRYRQDGTGAKPWEQVREEWVAYCLLEYYKSHLEEFSDDFRQQIAEFRDGNLFFEIMQQEVWNKAQADTAALRTLYLKQPATYLWGPSADAVLFFCSDLNSAQVIYDRLKAQPADWKRVTEQFPDKVIADSARYEWEQLPNLQEKNPRPGVLTPPLLNNADNTASFAYIIRVHPQPTQRSFIEARGLVINDYQTLLEKEWEAALARKYPVKINEKVFAAIAK